MSKIMALILNYVLPIHFLNTQSLQVLSTSTVGPNNKLHDRQIDRRKNLFREYVLSAQGNDYNNILNPYTTHNELSQY